MLALSLSVLTLVTALLSSSAASSASSASQKGASPQLVIDETRRDFGEVFAGEELSHVVTVRNIGTAPLELGDKALTSQSLTRSLVYAGSQPTHNLFSNYLRPVAAIKRAPAPT